MTKSSELPSYLVDNWQPYSTYTCKLGQIRAWFFRFGRNSMYGGKLWTLKHERLCPGVYEVKFEEV